MLGQLSIFIRQTQDLFIQKTGGGSKGVPKGKNLPDSVNNIVFVQQLVAKVCIDYVHKMINIIERLFERQ